MGFQTNLDDQFDFLLNQKMRLVRADYLKLMRKLSAKMRDWEKEMLKQNQNPSDDVPWHLWFFSDLEQLVD